MKRFINIFYVLFFSINCFGASYTPTSLMKVFYHQGILGDKVVCYFDNKPLCNSLPKQDTFEKNGKQKIEFFLPMAIIANNDARKMLQKVNNDAQREHYSINFAQEEKPVKGLKVSIEYDPNKIICDYTTCDSISNQKSLVFNFHNKKGVEAIQLHNGSILRTVFNHTKPHIMLDFGHGGEDNGKIGCNMVKEKDINIQIGTKLAKLLKQKGYRVSFTRVADIFVSLDERTSKANKHKVDLFLSLHSNAAHVPTISGIETYWTSRNTLTWKHLTRESEQAHSKIRNLHLQLDKASESFAKAIHEKVMMCALKHHPVNNRTIKQSVAQVLFGTEMPSALIEMGFLTNPKETEWLMNPYYQRVLAHGICEGIESYCKTLKSV